MDELLEHLSFYHSPDFNLVRFGGFVYDAKKDELTTTILYDERITKKLKDLKPILEGKFEQKITCQVKHKYDYQKSFIDALMLKLKTQNFLRESFSIMTLDLTDEDVVVIQEDDTFRVDMYLIPQAVEFIGGTNAFANFKKELSQNFFYKFNFFFNKKTVEEDNGSIERLEEYLTASMQTPRVDKTMKINGKLEYFIGRPIKQKPIKIQYLKPNGDDQVIAGTIHYMTKREYKKSDGTEAQYFSFVLDDGAERIRCVYFPRGGTFAKFETLVNGTFVAVLGERSEKNGKESVRVTGVSLVNELPA